MPFNQGNLPQRAANLPVPPSISKPCPPFGLTTLIAAGSGVVALSQGLDPPSSRVRPGRYPGLPQQGLRHLQLLNHRQSQWLKLCGRAGEVKKILTGPGRYGYL